MVVVLETNRKMSKRRIYAAGSTQTSHESYTEYKVIDEITFQVAEEYGQEYTFKFYNTLEGSRVIAVKDVDGLKVERIKEFEMQTAEQFYQMFVWAITGWESNAKPSHLETHEFKVNQGKSPTEITLQRIDRISFTDPNEYGQEYEFQLKWPDDDNQDKSSAYIDDDWTTINPPYRMDPFQTIVAAADLYMLVLYGNNQLAYVAMKELNSGFPSTNKWKHETRTLSYWGKPSWSEFAAYTIDVLQMKFDPKFHVLFTNANITDGVLDTNVSDYGSENQGKAYVSNCKNSIHQYVTPTRGISPYSEMIMQFINGSGNKVYDMVGNIYSVTSNGTIVLEHDNDSDYYYILPSFVASDGSRYSGSISGVYPVYAYSGGYGPFTTAQADAFDAADTANDALKPPPPYAGGSTIWGDFYVVNYGPGDATNMQFFNPTVETAYAVNDPDSSLPPEPDRTWFYYPSTTATLTLKHPMYSNNGVVDIISPYLVSYTHTVVQDVVIENYPTVTNYPAHKTTTVTVDVPAFGMSETATSEYAIAEISITWTSRLPGYNNKGWGGSQSFEDGLYTDYKYVTPYTPLQTTVNSYYSFRQRDVWHCSNGKHCLQCVDFNIDSDTTRTVWLNGNEVSTALGAVAGGINNVRAVFFDIKKSDITKLK